MASSHAWRGEAVRRLLLTSPEQGGAGRLLHSSLWLQRLKYSGIMIISANVSRGKRKISDQDALIPSILEPYG